MHNPFVRTTKLYLHSFSKHFLVKPDVLYRGELHMIARPSSYGRPQDPKKHLQLLYQNTYHFQPLEAAKPLPNTQQHKQVCSLLETKRNHLKLHIL